MRTLSEIIDDAKDGNMPSHEECYYAMLALDALWLFDRKALFELACNKSPFRTPAHEVAESYKRAKAAWNKSPKDWLGKAGDPRSEEYQEHRRIAKKLFDKCVRQNQDSVTNAIKRE